VAEPPLTSSQRSRGERDSCRAGARPDNSGCSCGCNRTRFTVVRARSPPIFRVAKPQVAGLPRTKAYLHERDYHGLAVWRPGVEFPRLHPVDPAVLLPGSALTIGVAVGAATPGISKALIRSDESLTKAGIRCHRLGQRAVAGPLHGPPWSPHTGACTA